MISFSPCCNIHYETTKSRIRKKRWRKNWQLEYPCPKHVSSSQWRQLAGSKEENEGMVLLLHFSCWKARGGGEWAVWFHCKQDSKDWTNVFVRWKSLLPGWQPSRRSPFPFSLPILSVVLLFHVPGVSLKSLSLVQHLLAMMPHRPGSFGTVSRKSWGWPEWRTKQMLLMVCIVFSYYVFLLTWIVSLPLPVSAEATVCSETNHGCLNLHSSKPYLQIPGFKVYKQPVWVTD